MIVITGGGGMLGLALSRLCLMKGIAFEAFLKKDLDVTNLPALERFFEHKSPSLIINCAAYTNVDGAESDAEAAFSVNALGPLHLGVISAQYDIPLIHISTDYVFDGAQNTPYREGDAMAPIGIYGKSKMEGERLLLAANPRACVVRTSWLFGAGGRNFVSSIISLMQTQESLKVINDQKGRPTYVDDLAEVILKMNGKMGVYHFANEGACSRYEMAVDIKKMLEMKGCPVVCKEIIPVSSLEFPTRASRPPYSVLNTAKIEHELKSRPRTWLETLEDYV